jgi:integrase
MGKRPGAKYVVLKQLDALMSKEGDVNHKRADAKAAAQLRGESLISWSDGRMRAFETRDGYQAITMRFLTWCQSTCDIHDPEIIETYADRLASQYLTERMKAGKSAWTLKTERSALRLLFQNKELTASVKLPRRLRKNIKRSRRPAKRDKQINLTNWQHVILFCLASGLRREELRDLRVHDIYVRSGDQHLVVRVRKGKGGKWREVKVFEGREHNILSQTQERVPEEHVFTRITGLLDIHSFRRKFAQELYEQLSGKPLPPFEGRLKSPDLDKDAALEVSRRLGHNRIDIIFGHYLV